MAKAPGKKTIYIDVDDEITGIIDKVRSAPESIVALVLPKRAPVLQSIVNMKLLKRSADQADKKVVLITSEPSLLPLAGTAGIFVAKNLQSRPVLPSAAVVPSKEPISADEPMEEVEIDPNTPIGEAAGLPAEQPPIVIDNSSKSTNLSPSVSAAMGKAGKKAKDGKGKSKLSVPNFNKFRVLLIAGAALLVLALLGWYWAYFIAPKAVVHIKGETSDVLLNLPIKADTAATAVDLENKIVPAKSSELKKSDSEKVPATGQKDKGNKASGTMTLKNCSQSDGEIKIPAGTGVSSGEFTFITQAAATLPASVFSGGGSCLTSSKDVAVLAQNAGDKYNVSARSYTVAGFSAVNANGSAMTGGTTQLVKVVSAGDVENAKQKLASKQNAVNEELKSKLKSEGYVAVSETFEARAPAYKASPEVDSEANEVTVSADTTFTMLGLREDELKKLVEEEAKKQIDTSKQAIMSTGLHEATFTIGAKKNTRTDLNFQTKVVAGPEINQDQLKQELAGKKRGEAEQLIASRPGVKEAKIDLKPFWIYSVPKKVSKITIVVEEADGTEINP